MDIAIKRCFAVEENGWLGMRLALWPHCTRDAHLSEMETWCADPQRCAAFLAYTDLGESVGFAEASIRYEYVNGTDSSPTGFLEDLYVVPSFRKQGVARKLVAEVEQWVRAACCRELASDADLDNTTSQVMHRALGFKETEHTVFFQKQLAEEMRPQ